MHKDRKIALVLFVLSIIVLVAANNIPKATLGVGPGPGSFPAFIAIGILVLSVTLWFTAGLKKKKEEPKEAKQAMEEVIEIDEPVREKMKRILGCIGLLMVYFVILPILGFIPATLLFGMAFLQLLYRMDFRKCIVPAATIAVFGFVLFELALSVPLPAFMETFK